MSRWSERVLTGCSECCAPIPLSSLDELQYPALHARMRQSCVKSGRFGLRQVLYDYIAEPDQTYQVLARVRRSQTSFVGPEHWITTSSHLGIIHVSNANEVACAII